jgi:hypothetical protein
MRTGEELDPPVLEAYEISHPFKRMEGARLPPGLPHLAAHESYWTAALQPLSEHPAWQALVQDVEARSRELVAATTTDTPPAIWLAAAVRRERGSSYQA